MKIRNKKGQDTSFLDNIIRFLLWAALFVVLFFVVRWIVNRVAG